jgi:hypothetical protein
MATFLAAIAAPLASSVIGSFLGGTSGASGSSGNPLSLFADAFKGLLGQLANHPLTSLVAPAVPALFSMTGMSPQAINDPHSQLRPDMDRLAYVANGNVRDHRGSGGVVVRDHRTGTRTTYTYTSTDGSGVLNQLQSEADNAKAALMADPKNAAKALEAQEAMQALQTVAQLLFQENSIQASIASNAIQSSKVS